MPRPSAVSFLLLEDMTSPIRPKRCGCCAGDIRAEESRSASARTEPTRKRKKTAQQLISTTKKMVSEKKTNLPQIFLSHFGLNFFSADSIFQLVSTNISIINSRRLASNWFNENAFILFCFVFCFVCSLSAQYFCTFFKLSRIFSRFRGQWSKKLVSFRKLIKKLKGLNCCRLTKHFGSMSERNSFKSSLSCLLGADQQM